jgi:CysZ protein
MDLIKIAIIDYTRSLMHFRDKRLWIMLIIPGLISFIIGFLFLYGAYISGAAIADFLSDLYPFKFGKKAAFTFFHLIPVTYLIAIMIVKYVIYIAIYPFMTILSAKIENEYDGASRQRYGAPTFNSILRALRVTLRSLYKEILWTILFTMVGILIPVAGIAGIFIVQSYYIGIIHLDYTLSRKMTYPDMLVWTKKNRGLPLGNGFVYITLISIPFFGILLAPVAATGAGTISVLDKIKLSDDLESESVQAKV